MPEQFRRQAASATEADIDPALAVRGEYETVLTRLLARPGWFVCARRRSSPSTPKTTSLDAGVLRIVGVSFAQMEPGRAAYVAPGARLPRCAAAAETAPRCWRRSNRSLEDPRRPKLGQHAKYDINVLANHGIALQGFGLRPCSSPTCGTPPRPATTWTRWRHLGVGDLHYEDVTGRGGKPRFSQVGARVPPNTPPRTPASRPAPAPRALWPKLQGEPAAPRVRADRAAAGAGAGIAWSGRGALVDAAALKRQSQELARRMARTQQRAYALAGRQLQPGPPKQLRPSCSRNWAPALVRSHQPALRQ